MTRTLTRTTGWIGLCASALALAACGDESQDDAVALTDDAWNQALGSDMAGLPPLPAAMPMEVAGTESAPVYAPAADRLPAAQPIRYAPAPQDDSYAWIERADRFSDMLGDAPPDYAFDYDDGVAPWAWQSNDDYVRYIEPIDGGMRSYYYEPGAATPFLVRDPWHSYGYREDRLTVVYDNGGRVLPWREARAREIYASRYHARARDMRRAAQARERRRIEARQWAARQAIVARDRARWAQARQQQAQWNRYHARQEQRERAHWANERRAREQATMRFASWRQDDFRGPSPFVREQRRQAQAAQAQAFAQRRAAEAARERRANDQRHWVARQRADARQDARQRQAEQRRWREQQRAEARQDQRQRAVMAERAARQQAQARRAQQVRAEQAKAQRAQAQRAQAQRQVVERLRQANRRAEAQKQARAREQIAERQQAARRDAAARQARAQRQQAEQRRQVARQQQQQRQAEQRRQQATRQTQQAEQRRAQVAQRAKRQVEQQRRQIAQRQQQVARQQKVARQQQVARQQASQARRQVAEQRRATRVAMAEQKGGPRER